MDGSRFDTLTRSLSEPGTRRRLIGGLIAGALGAVASRGTEAATCRAPGLVCREHANCCSGLCGPRDRTGRRRCQCQSDAECPVPAGTCAVAACTAGACEAEPVPNGTHCGTVSECVDGACVDPCAGQCLDGYCASTVEGTPFCAGTNGCAFCIPDGCATSDDCASGQVCASRLFLFGEPFTFQCAAPTFCVTASACG